MFAMLLYLQEGLAFKSRLSGTEGAVDIYVAELCCLTES